MHAWYTMFLELQRPPKTKKFTYAKLNSLKLSETI